MLDAQASLIALPDELLGGILWRAWADRPPRAAAEEVRAAAGLASVCRRWRELLRTQALPLVLDFSAARLSDAQRCWLHDPAQAGRGEAASFHDEDVLWERTLLGGFLALHSGTLLAPVWPAPAACGSCRPQAAANPGPERPAPDQAEP